MKQGHFLSLLFAVVTIVMWAMPNQPQGADVTMVSGKFNSVSYTPYRPGQGPLDKTFPSPADIRADFALIKTQADGIRTYSSVEGTVAETNARLANHTDLAGLAQQAGLKVWLGIWLSSDPKHNQAEMAEGIREANEYPTTVTRVVVGNEVLLRRDLSVDDLIKDIDHVRAQVKQPVAYADVTHFWNEFPQVAPHVDIVMIHVLPYWENTPLSASQALAKMGTIIDHFKTLFPGKTISIGETGWPSAGRGRGPAQTSRVEEAMYLRRFVTLAAQKHVDYNLIEAFDQDWKYEDEGIAGANWGIWTANRTPKFPLQGGVVENPAWPWYAALAVALGLALYAGIGFREARLALPAFALGNGLAFAACGTLPYLYDHWLWLDALVNLPLQALFAWEALTRADARLARRPPPPAVSGAEVLAALRRGRILWSYDALWFLFLAAAAIDQARLVFAGRYLDAPMACFIIPAIAGVLRFYTKDFPKPLRWEELLAANALALLALADLVIEGAQNLEFVLWNIAALVIAAPVVAKMPGRRARAAQPLGNMKP
ncbi:glycoside hydrolase [Acidocella sp.]|uniref:glycoside hydrolase family 17 protein n=1 Tax=Acidocella sp. TaxID=50710 RepID=UPI00262E4BA3|nr:glycoside hydrolase [Acidocella sp.]